MAAEFVEGGDRRECVEEILRVSARLPRRQRRSCHHLTIGSLEGTAIKGWARRSPRRGGRVPRGGTAGDRMAGGVLLLKLVTARKAIKVVDSAVESRAWRSRREL